MAVTGRSVILNATGPTAVLAPATTSYTGVEIGRGDGWLTVVINNPTGAAIYLGGNATGSTATMAAFAANTVISLPLGPDEGIYGMVNSGNQTIGVITSGS